jgi:hypothetical protein
MREGRVGCKFSAKSYSYNLPKAHLASDRSFREELRMSSLRCNCSTLPVPPYGGTILCRFVAAWSELDQWRTRQPFRGCDSIIDYATLPLRPNRLECLPGKSSILSGASARGLPMAHPQLKPTPLKLPAELDAAVLPRFCTAKQFQEIAFQYYGPHSAAVIRRWSLSWRRVNGHDVAPTNEFVAEAEKRLANALMLSRGKEPTPATATAKAT